jgi:NodT family efflux transporter outer membrane factor (OMF) lipoprotein
MLPLLPFFVLAAALLAGCNFAPKYARPTMETPPAFKEINGWKMAQPSDHVLRGKWWEMFNDPLLNSLEEQCTRSNQNVKAAFGTFLASRAVAKQAWAGLWPTVSATPSVTRLRQAALRSGGVGTGSAFTTDDYELPFDASWEPDFWGSLRNTLKANEYAAQSSAANLQNALLLAQADLAGDYYQLRTQDSLKKLLDDTVVAYKHTYDLNVALFKTGINSDENVAQAETQWKTTLAQATGVDIQRQQLEHAIAVLVGEVPSTFSIPVAPLKDKAPDIPVSLPSELLERRPDIAAAERTVAQYNAQIGVARAAYFPTITLSAAGGWESSKIESLFNGPSLMWSIGASAAETIFDAGRRKAVVEQAKAQREQAAAAYRQTVLAAFQAVEDNLVSLRVLATQIRQADDAVDAAQRNLNLALNRYQLGIDSYLNVITAQTTLLSNQQTALTLRQQRMTSSVQLIMALGGGWSEQELPAAGKTVSHRAPNPPQP